MLKATRENKNSKLEKNGFMMNYVNPFNIPSDEVIFDMKDKERQNKKLEKERNAKLTIFEKSGNKITDFRSLLAEDDDEKAFKAQLAKQRAEKFDVRGNRNFNAKENLTDFMSKKREMFFLQYTLDVKKAEMQKLEMIAKAEESRLQEDELALELDAAKFDAFLKENDKNSVEAIKRAEVETKAKLEKMQEIKKLNFQITTVRSEMSKNDDLLKDYKRYKEFLDKLTPPEWKVQHGLDRKSSAKNSDGNGNDFDLEDFEDITEEEIFFKHPSQLMAIFAELEEHNLVLIQTCQETEETLEEIKKNIHETETRMQNETQTLRQQIDVLNLAIAKEEEKAAILEEKSKLFSVGLGDAEYQERMLIDLDSRIKEAYKKCIGDSDSDLSTIQMLTSIENKLENLLTTIETMPSDLVEQAEKMRDKERRLRVREEKLEAQKLLQEERIRKALERAKAAPVNFKKPTKQILFRSQITPKKHKKKTEIKNSDGDDLKYFFSDDV